MVNGSLDDFERYTTQYTMQTSRDRYFQSFPEDTIQDLDDLGGPCTGPGLSLHPFTIGGFLFV